MNAPRITTRENRPLVDRVIAIKRRQHQIVGEGFVVLHRGTWRGGDRG